MKQRVWPLLKNEHVVEEEQTRGVATIMTHQDTTARGRNKVNNTVHRYFCVLCTPQEHLSME